MTDRTSCTGSSSTWASTPVRIVKTRRTARLGELVLCLDEVEHLGTFWRSSGSSRPAALAKPCRLSWTPSPARSALSRSARPRPTTRSYAPPSRVCEPLEQHCGVDRAGSARLPSVHRVCSDAQGQCCVVGQLPLSRLLQIRAGLNALGRTDDFVAACRTRSSSQDESLLGACGQPGEHVPSPRPRSRPRYSWSDWIASRLHSAGTGH